MVLSAVRRSLLAEFPRGLPLVILAPAETGFERIAAETGDDAIAVRTLAASGVLDGRLPEHVEHCIVEGFDHVDDAAALARMLRASLPPSCRLFALIANGANARALQAFFGGEGPRAHPLVAAELPSLFEQNGWRVLALRAIPDPTVADALPVTIDGDHLRFHVDTPERLATLRTLAFVAICDPAA